MSVYAAFATPVTLGLNVYLTDIDGINVALIDYSKSNVTMKEFIYIYMIKKLFIRS